MIIWIFTLIFDIIFNIICYLTNPIVCLFANEVGELPKIFFLWAQYDDGLDIEWFVSTEHLPSWMVYDFKKHYKFVDTYPTSYVILIDPNFTIKERIQRYFCRLAWMYRNCAYGFSYYIVGRIADGDKIKDLEGPAYFFGHEVGKGKGIIFRYYENWKTFGLFCLYGWFTWYTKDHKIFRLLGIDRKCRTKVFVGYKMQSVKPGEKSRCMLVLDINPFRVVYPKNTD